MIQLIAKVSLLLLLTFFIGAMAWIWYKTDRE